jgi:hypothetical protein
MLGKDRRNPSHLVSATVAWVAHNVGKSICRLVGLSSSQLSLTLPLDLWLFQTVYGDRS